MGAQFSGMGSSHLYQQGIVTGKMRKKVCWQVVVEEEGIVVVGIKEVL
jgi:hypothetical protein